MYRHPSILHKSLKYFIRSSLLRTIKLHLIFLLGNRLASEFFTCRAVFQSFNNFHCSLNHLFWGSTTFEWWATTCNWPLVRTTNSPSPLLGDPSQCAINRGPLGPLISFSCLPHHPHRRCISAPAAQGLMQQPSGVGAL